MFNDLLKKILENKTQQQAAQLLCIDQSNVSRKLNNKSSVSIEEVIRAAETFGIPIDSICDYCLVKKMKKG